MERDRSHRLLSFQIKYTKKKNSRLALERNPTLSNMLTPLDDGKYGYTLSIEK